MQRIFVAFLGALLIGQGAFATELDDMKRVIREAQEKASSMIDSVIVDMEDRMTEFPEYREALRQLVVRIERAGDAYNAEMERIRDYVQNALQAVYSEIARLEEAYKNNPTPELHHLIEEKKKATKVIKEHLQEEVNRNYAAALYNFTTLHGFLNLPVYKRFRVAAVAANTAVCGPLLLEPVSLYVLGLACVAFYEQGGLFNMDRGLIRQREVIGEWEVTKRRHYDSQFAVDARRIYSVCPTASCTYFIESDYVMWLAQALSLNKQIRLMPGVVLNKSRRAPISKISKAFHRAAEFVASRQNTDR